MCLSDSADAGTVLARQWSFPGSWDHIAVVYDAPTRTATLYVNSLPSAKTGVSAFDAGAPSRSGGPRSASPSTGPEPSTTSGRSRAR